MLELDYATNYLFLHEVKVCVTHSCSYKLYEYLICLRLIECNILNLQWITASYKTAVCIGSAPFSLFLWDVWTFQYALFLEILYIIVAHMQKFATDLIRVLSK